MQTNSLQLSLAKIDRNAAKFDATSNNYKTVKNPKRFSKIHKYQKALRNSNLKGLSSKRFQVTKGAKMSKFLNKSD